MRGKFKGIGRLDRRIVIQSVDRSSDDYGDAVATYSTLDTVWASRDDVTGVEDYEGRQLTAVRTVNWGIRYLSTVKEDFQILYDSETFTIIGIEEVGRKWGMILKTEKKV